MIWLAEYELARDGVSKALSKLELDLELHKVLHSYLTNKILEEKRKNPPAVNTT